MGEQNSDQEQDRPVMEKSAPTLLQQQKEQPPYPGTAKAVTRTKTTATLEAAAELHTIATKQITENSECIPGSTPLTFIKTSPPDCSDAVPSPTEDTKTAAAAAAAVAVSSPTDMEGVIEEEIAMLQIQQTQAEGGFTTASLLDGASPIQTNFASPSDAAPLTPAATQSTMMPKECNVPWPQTPESVVQEQKQEQEQSEPMDEDVIMEEPGETCSPAVPTSQEAPAVANMGVLEAGSDEVKNEKNQQDMDDSDSESDQDDDDCNDNDNDDDEDDEEAPSDKKGKTRDGSSSSSNSLPREPTILSFDDAVYSAVPVSSELYIIPFCSKGFNWNADLFLKPHQRRNLGLDDLYRTLSTESRVSSSGSTSTTTSSSDGSTDSASVDSRSSSSGASNNGHSHGSAIHVHEIWLSDFDTATILPA